MVSSSIKAAEILKKHNLKASVINVHTIKPLDLESVKKYSEKKRLIVTVEEHSAIGGLGSAISNANGLMPNKPRLLSISLPDKYFNTGGEYLDLLQKYKLDAEGIADSIKVTFNKMI